PAASPVTVRFGLIPRYIRHRGMRLQRHQRIEVLPQPLRPLALPVQRVLRLGLSAPDPALITPPVTPLIAPIVYKRSKFRVGHGCPSDAKRRDVHRMGPLFVVKHKRLFRRGTKIKRPAWDVYIPRPWSPAQLRRQRIRPLTPERRCRVGE